MSILCELSVMFPVYSLVSDSFQITFYIITTLMVQL